MDLMQRMGNYPLPKGASTILGVEFSGTIEQTASNESQWKVGDEIFGITSGVSHSLRLVSCIISDNRWYQTFDRSAIAVR